MSKLVTVPDGDLVRQRNHGFFDDFDHLVTADRWTTVASDGGTVSVSDGAGGIVTLDPSDATVADNDEAYLHTTTELFKFANEKPLIVVARVQFTEANTDDANIMFGLMDGVAANAIQDDGAGPKASYSGAVFFKADGSTKWSFESSLAGTQTTTEGADTAGGSSYQTLAIEARSRDATTVELIPYIDPAGGVNLKQMLDANGNKIKHTITLGSPTEMAVVLGVKNGGANQETLLCDYVKAYQLR